MTAAERVAHGAQLLDEKRPSWAERINLAHLNLASDCQCIIGQLWGGEDAYAPYTDGIYALGLNGRDGQAHGFQIENLDDMRADRMAAYAELDELWIAEVQRRTGGPA